MSEQIDRQDIAKRYLLDDLPEEEKLRLEEELFTDELNFQELEIAEDELVDGYVKNELSPADKKSFEKLLISPRLRERVELARILTTTTARQGNPQMSWWQSWFGSAGLASSAVRPTLVTTLLVTLLMGIAVVLLWSKWRNESRLVAVGVQQQERLGRKIEEEQLKLGELETKLNQTRRDKEEQERLLEEYRRQVEELERKNESLVLSFILFPGGVRGTSDSSRNKVTIEKGTSTVDLFLNVAIGDYASYNAVIQDDNLNRLLQLPNLKPVNRAGSKYIRCRVPARLMRPGSYNVHVDGITAAGDLENFEDYPFRVISR